MSKYLCREGNVFLFRRRVPEHLQTRIDRKEIYHSLKTSMPRLARQRAAALFLATERLFAMAADDHLSDEDIRAAARHWLSQPGWQETLARGIDSKRPGDLRREANEIPKRLLELATDEEAGITPLWARRHEAYGALQDAGYPLPSDMSVLDRTAEALLDLIRERVEKRMQTVFRPEDLATAAVPERAVATTAAVAEATSEPAATPLISEHVAEWLAYIQSPTDEGEKPIPFLHAKQKGVTVRILTELIGDRPVGTVTRDDAKEFRRQLLRLPSSHGKGRYVHAREAIAKAEGSGVNLMTLKTVKRYFSALNGYWKWLRDRKHIPDAPSPFTGHSFPGTKSSKSNRDDWSVRDLERLFKSADYQGYAWDSADHWLPLIALHSGMRLEEIARLRVEHDVIFEGKVNSP